MIYAKVPTVWLTLFLHYQYKYQYSEKDKQYFVLLWKIFSSSTPCKVLRDYQSSADNTYVLLLSLYVKWSLYSDVFQDLLNFLKKNIIVR